MSNSIFQNVVTPKKRYNNFPLGREVLLTGQIGKLIPVQCDEIVPGDRVRQTVAFLMRFSPLSAPAMARFNVHFHTFFVPLRILTDESGRESTYERLIKSFGKPTEEVPVLPYMYGNVGDAIDPIRLGFEVGSLSDYLGLPINNPIESGPLILFENLRISLMPHLAYQRIYQDFYRRDQLEKEIIFPHDVGGIQISTSSWDDLTDTYAFPKDEQIEENQVKATKLDYLTLRTRNYERDYFTSALPEPQFGDEVSVGDGNIDWMGDNLNVNSRFLSGDTAIYHIGALPFGENNFVAANWNEVINSSSQYNGAGQLGSGESGTNGAPNLLLNATGHFIVNSQDMQAVASKLRGNSITVNELRLAMQLQGVLETINRTGTRYLEIMRGIYGVIVPDARLQRPIYLGGFKSPVSIGSVMQTSETDSTPQGTLSGQMSAAGSNILCKGNFEFVEHGYLMTILSVTPRTSYFGGLPKKFTKYLPEDFYLPQFDHLGEQEIKRHELYYDNNINEASNTNLKTFGYTPRYAELKSSLSSVHGEFRTTLMNWHVSRDFNGAPSLNPDFIKAEPEDFDRLFMFPNIERTSNEHFQCQIYLDVRAKRNMSKYSTPYTFY